jgi:antitoxin VapB
MASTHLFKDGSSQALRIPADLAYSDIGQPMEVVRRGALLIAYPAPARPLADVMADLGALPPLGALENREPISLPDRE